MAGESAIRNVFGNNPNNAIVLRLSNIYGYPINKEVDCWHLFINNICKEIIQKETITIKSNPLIKRDFLSVKSFCEMILKLSIFKFKSTEQNILNFGSEKSQSLIEIAKIISQIYFDKYKKTITINTLKSSFDFNHFQFCNQVLESNNLNFKKTDFERKEIEDLLEKCEEYFY